MLCPAAVTNLEGDFGTTKDIALIGSLAETDPFIASGDVATLAKIAALHLCASDMVDGQRPTSVSPPGVNCFTQSAQIRHAMVRSFFWDRPPLALNAQRPPITDGPGAQIGGPLWGEPRLHSQGRVVDSERFETFERNQGLSAFFTVIFCRIVRIVPRLTVKTPPPSQAL